MADRFPDGQLYVDLRGFGPSGVAADPTAVIHGFLDALGVPGERLPSSPEGSAALYRSVLTGRQVLVVLGNYERAIAECQRALAGFRRSGFRRGEASALDSLGWAHHQLGDHTQAIARGQEALRIFRMLGDRYDEAEILTHLGDALQAAGDHQAARHAWQQALAILDDLQHPDAAAVQAKLQSLRIVGDLGSIPGLTDVRDPVR